MILLHLTKFAEMVYGVTKEVTKLGLSLIEEELESYDELCVIGRICEKDGILNAVMKRSF